MTIKTKVIKKIVCDGKKRYQLIYSLLSDDSCLYGIEVICRYRNITEAEQIWVGKEKQETLGLLYLFAKETVFPIALRETFENL